MPRQGLDTEQVLDAAMELADAGIERVTLASVAGVLGVRPPSLYNHVEGRHALLRLMKLRALGDLAEAIAGAAAGLAGEDALRATAHAYREYAHAHRGGYECTIAAPAPGDLEARAAAERVLSLLAAILRAWHLEGDAAIDAIRVVRSALHGFVTLENSGAFALKRDAERSFGALVDTLVLGLSSIAEVNRAA
ncbi:MAG TPA: WHG domain-containing protein [Solirubrobacteraceae bacterium]|jgi:AcrR family transcriptional regulator|nr:WHG domain-containing protein [Solirubrobacteraceae bacterium]